MSLNTGDELLGVEAFRLAELEEVIERGLSSFIEVGEALIEVQERRLYRRFGTFEEYCRDRWGFSRPRAYQLMQAAEMSTKVDTAIEREAHARELAPLSDDPEALNAAAAAARETAESEGRAPIARDYREAVQQARPSAVASVPATADYVADEDDDLEEENDGMPDPAAEPDPVPVTLVDDMGRVSHNPDGPLTLRQWQISRKQVDAANRIVGMLDGWGEHYPEIVNCDRLAAATPQERKRWGRVLHDSAPRFIRQFRAALNPTNEEENK